MTGDDERPPTPEQPAETPSSPQTHVIGPGEITMSGESGLAVGTDRYVPTKNNTDIGKAAAVRNYVRAKARKLLMAGWPDSKEKLNEHLSKWLKSGHHLLPGDPLPADDLHLHPHEIGRVITPEWREFHPDDAATT
jgi:hypothetical protein